MVNPSAIIDLPLSDRIFLRLSLLMIVAVGLICVSLVITNLVLFGGNVTMSFTLGLNAKS